MKRACRDLWEEIVALVEGTPSDRAQRHLDECSECSRKAAQLSRMMTAMSIPQFEAPAFDIEFAMNLMPRHVRRLGLLRTSLQLSAARSANQDFQAVYGDEELELRVMFAKSDEGWEVMSRLPEPDWRASYAETEILSDEEGRFRFEVESLDQTQFLLTREDQTIEIPSIEESLNGSPHSS